MSIYRNRYILNVGKVHGIMVADSIEQIYDNLSAYAAVAVARSGGNPFSNYDSTTKNPDLTIVDLIEKKVVENITEWFDHEITMQRMASTKS